MTYFEYDILVPFIFIKGGDSKDMSFETIKTGDIAKYIGAINVMIIDLRDKHDYDKGHIPTAVNIPYEELEDRRKSLPRHFLLIFYCDRGNVSLLAARDLMKDGYNIKSLYGGMRAYRGKLERSR